MVRRVLLAAAALVAAGCADLLGVEDVAGDGGGGGAGGAADAGGGAGLPGPSPSTGPGETTATSSGSGDGATTSVTTGETTATSTTATSSTGTGGSSCGAILPACAGVVPSALDSDGDLDLGFDRDGDSDEVDVAGGMLELEPRGDDDDATRYAAVKSKSPIAAPAAGACAVWVDLKESGPDLAAGIAIGPGTPSEDAYRLERRGVLIAARIDGADVAQVPYVKDVTRLLRIWLDASGQVGFDWSTDGSCWTAVGSSMAQSASEGLVRLHAEGEAGKAKLDDFCL